MGGSVEVMLRQRLKFHRKSSSYKFEFLMANFQDLQDQVARQKDVVSKALEVLKSVPEKVAAAVAQATAGAVDQSAFDALHADIKAHTDALEAALEDKHAA